MSPIQAINIHYDAIISKNAVAIAEKYMPTEELYVILEGPRLSNRGHDNISKGWADFCKTDISLASIVWIEGPFEEVHEKMAWVAGIVDLSIQVKDRIFSNRFRSTFVLTKLDGKWLISHEHVSAAMEDPYGIGDWLVK